MTTNQLKKRIAELEAALLTLAEPKPSRTRQLWNRVKPYLIPFILGVIVGTTLSAASCRLLPASFSTTLEHQAATGGAVIPFGNASPSPMLSSEPQGIWTTELIDLSLTNESEPPSQPSPQADNGQESSQESSRRTLLRRH
jgi:hypothetical protein